MMTLILFVIGIVTTLISIPMLRDMLEKGGLQRPNFKGETIPVGMGVCFIPALIINALLLSYCNIQLSRLIKVYILLFAIISMCFTGIIDDCIGNRSVTGLKGHFKSMLKGSLTTGGFKAILGGFVGLLIGVTITEDPIRILLATLIIALSTNFINLLDLRPGRALKVYIFMALVIFVTCSKFNRDLMTLILPSALAYFHFDVKAKSMMGDAGSNVLGVSLGVFMVLSYSVKTQVIYLIALVLIHLIAEKFSITKIIEKSKILNFLDKLGRS